MAAEERLQAYLKRRFKGKKVDLVLLTATLNWHSICAHFSLDAETRQKRVPVDVRIAAMKLMIKHLDAEIARLEA